MEIMLINYMVLSQKSENMSEAITDEDRVSVIADIMSGHTLV